MTLIELNECWRASGKPHASPVGGELFRPVCPWCKYEGTRLSLVGAMNEVLRHKQRCATVVSTER